MDRVHGLIRSRIGLMPSDLAVKRADESVLELTNCVSLLSPTRLFTTAVENSILLAPATTERICDAITTVIQLSDEDSPTDASRMVKWNQQVHAAGTQSLTPEQVNIPFGVQGHPTIQDNLCKYLYVVTITSMIYPACKVTIL